VEKAFNHILIARTDSIGDVMLTLPTCGVIKKYFPDCRITFLGKNYTKDIIGACSHVDHFLNADELFAMDEKAQVALIQQGKYDAVVHVFPTKEVTAICKKANIPLRIATTNRLFTWFTCNKKIHFSRKKSDLHESQLNMKLLRGLGLDFIPTLAEMSDYYGFSGDMGLIEKYQSERSFGKFRVLLHPLSKGSAINWSLANFRKLIDLLPPDEFEMVVTGTSAEGDAIKKNWGAMPAGVIDATGKYSLKELIAFISCGDALIAASTGPLHIAAATGINAIGLYSNRRPIHPGRWRPLGKNATVVTATNEPQPGEELLISPESIAQYLKNLSAARLTAK
jgi:ADP-heptose:LPS heptosyltransferase